jgi:3-phenylpropionate/cinnamic acid dioxygenase small subunit
MMVFSREEKGDGRRRSGLVGVNAALRLMLTPCEHVINNCCDNRCVVLGVEEELLNVRFNFLLYSRKNTWLGGGVV